MFGKMHIYDLPKDRLLFQKVIDKVLTGLPADIRTREVIEDHYFYYRVLFGDLPTNFYLGMHGEVIYLDKEDDILQMASKADLVSEYEKFKNSCD